LEERLARGFGLIKVGKGFPWFPGRKIFLILEPLLIGMELNQIGKPRGKEPNKPPSLFKGEFFKKPQIIIGNWFFKGFGEGQGRKRN